MAVGGVGGCPWRSVMWVVVRGGWRGFDFNVVAHCLLFFLQNRYQRFADADLLMF